MSEILGFLTVVILVQIAITLFIWTANLLSDIFIYPKYIANAGEHTKAALHFIAMLFKDCVAFICMIAVLTKAGSHGFGYVIILGLILISFSVHKSFRSAFRTLIQLNMAVIIIQNNLSKDGSYMVDHSSY